MPPADCGALDAALDISQPFTIGKTQHKALPDTVDSGRGKPDIDAVEVEQTGQRQLPSYFSGP